MTQQINEIMTELVIDLNQFNGQVNRLMSQHEYKTSTGKTQQINKLMNDLNQFDGQIEYLAATTPIEVLDTEKIEHLRREVCRMKTDISILSQLI